MLNRDRLSQLTALMEERQWDQLVLYGSAWRKEYFRTLVNFNYSGSHAAVVLDRSGWVVTVVSDSWDRGPLEQAGLTAFFNPDFAAALTIPIKARANVAIAGIGLMEARFVDALADAVSATAEVEELRRVKTPEEIDCLRRAAELAD